MLSFSVWTIVENVTIWLTANVGTFIVGIALTDHAVGLYKTTISTVNGYMNIISATVMQVLFSGLSRCQDDDRQFRNLFFKFQRMTALILIPLGFGMYVFRDLVVAILLGDQWTEVADFLGMWSATSALVVIFSSMNSEVFRSKGRPRLSVISQVLHLAALIPVLLLTMDRGFQTLTAARSLVRLQGIAVSLLLVHFVIRIPVGQVLKNTYPTLISAAVMTFSGIFLQSRWQSVPGQLLAVVICILVYAVSMVLLPEGRRQLLEVPVLGAILKKLGIK
jgi:PST family polysaccharide transporter